LPDSCEKETIPLEERSKVRTLRPSQLSGSDLYQELAIVPKSLPFAPCVFLPFRLREQVPEGAAVYDVSSYADHPYCTLSPFWPHGGIPVPGMPGTTSDSVEGIWQGLKLIDGKIAP
jgi:hypothetical protein